MSVFKHLCFLLVCSLSDLRSSPPPPPSPQHSGDRKWKLTHSFPQPSRFHSSLWLLAGLDAAFLFPHYIPVMTAPTLICIQKHGDNTDRHRKKVPKSFMFVFDNVHTRNNDLDNCKYIYNNNGHFYYTLPDKISKH